MSRGFALLRAPQVVQTQVLNIFKPQEVLILSLCSKRAYRLVKVHRRKPKKRESGVGTDRCPRLLIRYVKKKFPPEYECTTGDGMPTNRLVRYLDISKKPDQTEMINIGDTNVPASLDPDGILMTYWNHPVEGMKAVTDYVMRLFNMRIDVLEIEQSTLWLIDWINSRQESLKKAIILDAEPYMQNEEVHHILTNCKATEELILHVVAFEDFRFTGEFQKPNVLRINYSPWVTLDNWKSMDSVEIYLRKSNLTSSDMNLFLKHWLAGGSPRLSYTSIDMCRIDFDDVFKDLTEKIVHVPEKREFKLRDGKVISFEDTYEIEREDGAKASIHLKIDRTPEFYFFISPATEV